MLGQASQDAGEPDVRRAIQRADYYQREIQVYILSVQELDDQA